jgi:hypothetical protein
MHVESATAIGQTGELSLSGSEVAADLGLRSTWFEVGWLELTPPPSPVSFGATVTLTGVARGLGGVTLEAQSEGSTWEPLAAILPGRGGAFSMEVTPQETTRYRLASGAVRAALINVPVAPVVSASLVSSGVEGAVEPPASGLRVTLQRQTGQAWTTIASATTGPRGGYAFGLRLPPGSYRVRLGAGNGLATGLSGLLSSGVSTPASQPPQAA